MYVLMSSTQCPDVCLCRSWNMEHKLTFDSLRDLLNRFASENDTSKKYADVIAARINNGM